MSYSQVEKDMLKFKINALLKSKSDIMKEMSHGGTSIAWKCTVKK